MKKTIWYNRYEKLKKVLEDDKKSIKTKLMAVHSLVDSCRGYHYEFISLSAEEQIKELCKVTK